MIHKVSFIRSQISIDFDTERDTFSSILDLADKAGLNLRRGCRSGHCGACEIPLKSGVVEHIFGDKMKNLSPDYILSCSVKPKSDVELDA